MKTTFRNRVLAAVCLLPSAVCLLASAQPYAINWRTINGGFWGVIALLQTHGAPLLSIARTTTNTVAVFWPSPSFGFTLQQNTNSVSSVNWSNAPGTILDDGTTKTVIVNPPTGNRFYHLFKP